MPPPSSSISLLIGADTSLVDESSYARTLTPVGNAARTTINTKFGAGAITFDGTGDRLTAPNSAGFIFGNEDFTVEGWFRFLVKQTSQALCGVWSGSPQAWYFYLQANSLIFSISTSITLTSGFLPVLGQWYHIAADRSGITTRIYVDGVVIGSTNVFASVPSSTDIFVIGAIGDNNSFSSFDFNGQMDEIRITKGIAQYGGAFTPPAAPFSRDENVITAARLSQLPIEVVATTNSADVALRVSQAPIEVVVQSDVPINLRLSQLPIEIVVGPTIPPVVANERVSLSVGLG